MSTDRRSPFEKNTDSISLVLWKETEGKVVIINDPLPGLIEEGKDSLEDL